MVSIKRRAVTKDLVGMDGHKKAINDLLGTDSGGEFQVLLSFIEPHVQRIFAKTIYHALEEAGVLVVIDAEETQLERERAIDDLKIFIPFSPENFVGVASSAKSL